MKKIIFAFVSLLTVLFVSCAPLAPKPLTGSKLKKVKDSFAFSDENGEEGTVAGAVKLSIQGVALSGVTDFVVYYGTDAADDKQLVGSTSKSGFKEGTIATLSPTEFTGEEKLYLFLKNSAFTTGPNEVFSGVDLTVIDLVDEDSASNRGDADIILDHVLFSFDKYSLTTQGKTILDNFIASQTDLAELEVVIEGHADERGSNEYNIALGERRASSVKDYLILQGVPDANIEIFTFGEERPICGDYSESCWQSNRRAETKVFFK